MAAGSGSTSGNASDDAVSEATGRGWDEWFEWLHANGADELDHKGIVALLADEGEVDSGWWQQNVTVRFEQHIGRRRPGEAQDGTFQVGTRRTFRSSPMRVWELMTTPEGAAAWLGDTPDPWWDGHGSGPAKDDILRTKAGEEYEVRSYADGTRIRLRTLGPLLPRTTVQLTISGERGRTVVGLHQEGIPDEQLRDAMREQWKRALDRIAELLDEG